VVERAPSTKPGRPWKCLCDCGTETTAFAKQLWNNHKKSCGCLKRIKHPGLSPVPAIVAHSELARRRAYAEITELSDGQWHQPVRLIRDGVFSPDLQLKSLVIPWVHVERREDGKVRLTIDQELRDICDGRVPRPAMAGKSLKQAVTDLAGEIDRRRTANHEKQKTIRWHPELVRVEEQRHLLEWIETELRQVLSSC
jgi:hypothetical protein